VFASTQTRDLAKRAACPDPLYRGLNIRFRKRFVPLGKVVEVESNDPAVIEAALQSFARYGDAPATVQPEIHIQLCVDPVAQEAGPRPVPLYRGLQHLFHISCGPVNFAVADLKTGSAFGFVSREMVCDTSLFRNTFLECLFHVLAVHQSHTPVHCAAVALENRAVLICGPSGAGKTTLVYACAKAGMHVVSDDVIHLEWSSRLQRLILWGNPWRLRLIPDTCELFADLAGNLPQLGSDGGWYLEVDVPREFPGQAQVSCEPAALVFLERTPDTTLQCTPMHPSLALERLKRDIVLDEQSVVQRHYALLGRLIHTRAYTLKYSGHPSSVVDMIRSLFA
jgi:hypothetical protein